MQVTETLSEELKREYKVVVPANDLNTKVDARLAEVGSQVRIPGFRPGKVPLPILKKRFGGHVMGEVLEQLAQETVDQVIKDNELRPALQPKVEFSDYDPEGDFTMTIALEILPDLGSLDFSDIEVEREVVEVPESDVEAALENMARAQRTSNPVTEERPARSGDIVVIDFVGKKDDEPFPGGAAEAYELELGSGSFIPGFEEQLEGTRAGEQKVITITFPEDYGAKDLAGQTATFDVTIKELREPEDVAIDDELAKSYGRDSLEELKQAIRNRHSEEYQKTIREKTKRRLLDRLAERFTFQVPEGLVNAEFDGIWKQLTEAREKNQLDDSDKEKSEEELRAEYRGIAERRVRLGLLLARVGDDNEIKVTQADLNAALREQLMSFPGQHQAVMDYYQNNPEAFEGLRAPIFENKVIDYVLELAQVTDKPVTPEELFAPDPDDQAKTTDGVDSAGSAS